VRDVVEWSGGGLEVATPASAPTIGGTQEIARITYEDGTVAEYDIGRPSVLDGTNGSAFPIAMTSKHRSG
jgi:hypothetical protein